MKTKLVVGLIVIIVLSGVGLGFALGSRNAKSLDTPPIAAAPISSQQKDDSQTAIKEGGAAKDITASGMIGCLTPADSSGSQSANCARGLMTDDHKKYAIQADDPTLVESLSSGQHVRIKGVLINQANNYEAQGIIKVQTVERL